MFSKKCNPRQGFYLIVLVIVLISLAGCAQTAAVGADTAPAVLPSQPAAAPEKVVELATQTPAPQGQPADPAGSPKQDEPGWKVIELPSGELTFMLPPEWKHYGQDTNWSPDEGKTMIGLRQAWVEPGKEVEAGLFQPDSEIIDLRTVMVGEISVRRYQLKVYAHQKTPPPPGTELPVQGYAAHYCLRAPNNTMIFDFMAFAPEVDQLSTLDPIMEQVIASIQWGDLPVRPAP